MKGEDLKDKQYYNVTFRYSDSVWCTNLVYADDIDKVNKEYGCYERCIISKANEYDVESARRKHMPIVEV